MQIHCCGQVWGPKGRQIGQNGTSPIDQSIEGTLAVTIRAHFRQMAMAMAMVALASVALGHPAAAAAGSKPGRMTTSTTSTTVQTTTPTTKPATAPRLPTGISMGGYLPGLPDAQRAAVLDDAAALGVSWIRTDFSWSQIQPDGPSTYSWSKHDAVVQQAKARGLSVLPILDFTPPWARPAGCTVAACGPADPSQFATFAAAAATRYAPLGVHTWEIWNEPNITPFWAPRPDPAAYAVLLKAASVAIRSVDPAAVIVSAGISPAATVAGGNISQTDYVTALAQSGALAYADAVGYHPYSYPVLPLYPAPWNAWQIMGTTSPSIEGILAANGLAAKKIWITEYGAPTNGPGIGATADNLQLGSNA